MSAADDYRSVARASRWKGQMGREANAALAEIDRRRFENDELRGQRDFCQLMWAGEAKKVADLGLLLDAIEVAPWLDGMGEEMYAALTALVKWRAELPSPPASR